VPETLAGETLTAASGAVVPHLRQAWERLAFDTGSIFATPAWAETWWRHLGPSGEMPLPVAVRDTQASLVALVPLYAWRRHPVRVVRLIGHGPGDLLGPIRASGQTTSAAVLMRLALDMVGWDVFIGDMLHGGVAWDRAFDIEEARPTGSPVIAIEGQGWDDILAGMSSNARQQVRRRERNLHRTFEVTFRLADDAARLERDLETLFELHRVRWGGRASDFAGKDAPFHRAFARVALERGWLRLWFLELDGVPVAVWHGFRFAGIESYYQAGWDPAFARHSVSGVLLAHTIRAAAEDGMSEYRMLQGDESYKYRYATDDEGLVSLVAGNGRNGAAVAAVGLGVRRYARTARTGAKRVRSPRRERSS